MAAVDVWASLPAELVQRACAALEPQDSSWQAALAAAPHLAPPLVLRGPQLSVASLEAVDASHYSVTYESNAVESAVSSDTQAADAFLLSIAALHRKTWSVRLEGCQKQPSSFLAAALLLLPSNVREIDLAVQCGNPVVAALARCSQLRAVSISGNALGVSWRTPDAPAVLRKLASLRLDCNVVGRGEDMEELPPEVVTALAAGASALTHLTLDTYWTNDAGRLLTALPALRSLRRSFLGVCSSWQAALAAAPHLAPPLVLRGPPLSVASLKPLDAHEYWVTYKDNAVESAVSEDAQAADAFLLHIAALHPKTWSVRLEGCTDQPSSFLVAALLLLPSNVREIDLAVQCGNPVVAALARCSQLRAVSISGNALGVSWRTPDAPAVLPKLASLRLDCNVASWDDDMEDLPPEVATALAAGASALTHLTLDTYWAKDVGRLLTALPALRSLRLNLRYCRSSSAAAAVKALSSAPSLEQLSLCLASGDGRDDNEERGLPESFELFYDSRSREAMRVPPLARLAATLTELRLLCYAELPDDWPVLTSLCRLRVNHLLYSEDWLRSRLKRLHRLTSLCIDSRPPAVDTLAALPALAELRLFRDSMHTRTAYQDLAGGSSAFSSPQSASDYEAELCQKRPGPLVLSRQQPLASCSGRAPAPAATRALLPPGRRRAAAAVRAEAAGDSSTQGEQGLLAGREIVKQMNFSYMSPEDAAAAEAAAEAAWQTGMKEYTDLQEWLLFRTWRFGLLFAGYLLLAASGEAAFCELIGTAVGYGYFKWLIADVDRYQPGDVIPVREADAIQQPFLRGAAKVAAAYRQALQPRLLVLPGLLAAAAAWNAAYPEDALGLVEQGCLVGGFLSWKIALVLKIYEDLKPKPLTQEEIFRQARPMLVEVEDAPAVDIREISRRKAAEAAAAAAAAEQQAAAGQQQAPPSPQQPGSER
ncbi:hypothetical protein C2E21_7817 [Chlorella sorokiniana]|uniref:Uncharacterized protein n=1 Tax=Chlorella sorokiniana TaxID=3076 RepID=A0A2P6TGG3_CHLSO|nr:hypothetical protein C2E21_7817 [Chlorella sorokiniana]|eukprot:PRW33204.1 hypothetical protein C2E21_7817 [Chlorella sorokiniana]